MLTPAWAFWIRLIFESATEVIVGDDVKLLPGYRDRAGGNIFEQMVECLLAIDEKPALVETENGHAGQSHQGGISFGYGVFGSGFCYVGLQLARCP